MPDPTDSTEPPRGIEGELRRLRNALVVMFAIVVLVAVVVTMVVIHRQDTRADRDRASEVKCLYLDDC